jgi:hypothetical protein
MTIPSIFLGFVISTLYGSAYHMITGGRASRLLVSLIMGWIGFGIGQALGIHIGWDFVRLGQLFLGFASLSSILFLVLGHWLSRVEVNRK